MPSNIEGDARDVAGPGKRKPKAHKSPIKLAPTLQSYKCTFALSKCSMVSRKPPKTTRNRTKLHPNHSGNTEELPPPLARTIENPAKTSTSSKTQMPSYGMILPILGGSPVDFEIK